VGQGVGGRGRGRAQADLLQVRLCESRSDRELEVPYKPVVYLVVVFKLEPSTPWPARARDLGEQRHNPWHDR